MRWKVQGNEQKAKSLDQYLKDFSEAQDAEVSGPISNTGYLILYTDKDFSSQGDFKLPWRWRSLDLDQFGWIVREHSSNAVKKGNVVKFLRELDKKGITLPDYPGIGELPTIIRGRSRHIRQGLEDPDSRLSEVLENDPDFLSYNSYPDTFKHVSVEFPIKHVFKNKDICIVYTGKYVINQGKVHLYDVALECDGVIGFTPEDMSMLVPGHIKAIKAHTSQGKLIPREVMMAHEGKDFTVRKGDTTSHAIHTIYADTKCGYSPDDPNLLQSLKDTEQFALYLRKYCKHHQPTHVELASQ